MKSQSAFRLTKTLNNGIEIPIVGLGTFHGVDTKQIVYDAIKVGYRLIDTAWVYGNEADVGKGIKRALDEKLIKREELFVVTKLWMSKRHDIENMLKSQLTELQLEYVDLYLIHWPTPKFENNEWDISIPMYKVWEQMELMVEKKLTRSIGISNFNAQLILDMLCYAKIKPAVNQVEVNPYFINENLRKCCKKFDIAVMAYNPLHKGVYILPVKDDLFTDPLIVELSKKYAKSAAQIVLNWALCQGLIIIPKTSSAQRLEENLNVLSFKLDTDDADKVSGLNKNIRYCNHFECFGGLDPFA